MSFTKEELNKLSTGLAIGVYIIIVLLGIDLVSADLSQIAPILIRIGGAMLIALGILEIVITYINRKGSK
jgi:hypothetical protein